MGNTYIPLPSDVTEDILDPSIGISDGRTLQESRSVLKDEITVRGSLLIVMISNGWPHGVPLLPS